MVTGDCLEQLPTDALFRAIHDRCRATPGAGAIALGDLTLALGSGAATWRGARARLAGREAQLLAALMMAHPHGATGDELGWRVWRQERTPQPARVYVRSLRAKLPGLIPRSPSCTGRGQPYRLAVDPAALLTGALADAAATVDPTPVLPPRPRRSVAPVEPLRPAFMPGDEAFVWQQKFNRAYDRMFALEIAFSARLMRHNAGPDRSACTCAECAWLRTLFSATLPAPQRAEPERTTMIAETDAGMPPEPQPTQRRSFEALARGRLAEVERERTDVDQQLAELLARQRALLAEEAATRAAVDAYARALAAPVLALPAAERSRRRAPRGREPGGSILPMLLEMAQGGATVQRAAAIAAAAERGVAKTTVHRALVDSGRFERVGVGAYRLRADPAA